MDSKNKIRRKAKRSRKGTKKINPTMQSLIGVFVFALGLAAVIAVLYLGYTRFYGAAEEKIRQATVEENKHSVESYLGDATSERNLRKASYSDLVGEWQAKYGQYTAHINITPQKQFQITVFMDRDGYERLISWGALVFNDAEAILEFNPSYDRLPEVENADIKTLTRRKYGLVVLRDIDDGSILFVPRVVPGMRDQIHPVFTKMERQGSFIRLTPRKGQ